MSYSCVLKILRIKEVLSWWWCCARHLSPIAVGSTSDAYKPNFHSFADRCPCIARNTKIGGGRLRQWPSRQIFPWPSRCGGEEIRLIVRDKELFVNREQVRASFCKNGEAWFICVRSTSDGYWWKMGGTTSSPTQDLFDSQDFENAGIEHDNNTNFKLILQMLWVILHLRRGNY